MSLTMLARSLAMIAVFVCARTLDVSAAEPLVIARDGDAMAPIVVSASAGHVAAFAADELAFFLEKATAAVFEVRDSVPPGGPVILMGDTPESRKLGMDVSGLKRDGVRILRNGRFLLIAGRDDKTYSIENYANHVEEPPHRGRGWRSREIKPEHGTLFAAYEFLQRVVGIRWYYPGELGTSVPRHRTLAIDALDVTDEPRMVVRYMPGFGDWSIPGHTTWRMTDYSELGITRQQSTRWALRCRVSSLFRPVNHLPLALRFFYRYRESHPEYFALTEGGTRDIFWGEKTHNGALCYSHPDVIETIGDDAIAYFSGRQATELENAPWNARWDANRMQDVYFSLLPGDNFKGCRCQLCKSMVANELAQGAYSRIVWKYARQVAERVYAQYPDKRLTMLAYSHYRQPPPNMAPLPPNLLVGVTAVHLGNSSDNCAMRTVFRDINAWSRLTDQPLFLWSYHIDRPQYDGIPQPRLWSTGRFYNELAAYNVDGIFLETLVSQGFQAHLDVYLNLRLMWNPTLEADALISEYAERMYGPAAEHVLRFLKIVEDKWVNGIVRYELGRYRGAAYQDIIDIPAERWGREVGLSGLWEDVYTVDVMTTLQDLIDAAQDRLTGADDLTRRRFALFRERFHETLVARRRRDLAAE